MLRIHGLETTEGRAKLLARTRQLEKDGASSHLLVRVKGIIAGYLLAGAMSDPEIKELESVVATMGR